MTALGRRAFLGGLGGIAAGCARRPAPGEISLWFCYGGNNRKVLLQLVDRFHAEQSAVRVSATFQGDYFEGLIKLRTGLFVGAAPTVTHVVGEVLPYLCEAGVLMPLDGLGEAVLGDMDPALSQSGSFIGGGEQPLAGVPFNRSTPIACYDKALFTELGMAPPKTWDELRSLARALTVRDGDTTTRWGFSCPIDWWFWVALVGQAGGRILDPDGGLSLGGDGGVRAVSLWQTMVHEDKTMKTPPGRDYNAWEMAKSDLLARRVAMIWTSTAFIRELEDRAAFELGVAPLPADVRASVPTGGTFFVMPRGSRPDEAEAGMTFLRWMMRPAQANAWATATGYMPVSLTGREELVRSGYYQAHPNDRVAIDQLSVAQAWPWDTQLFRVYREAVQPRLESAVLERRDARTTLDEARRAAEMP